MVSHVYSSMSSQNYSSLEKRNEKPGKWNYLTVFFFYVRFGKPLIYRRKVTDFQCDLTFNTTCGNPAEFWKSSVLWRPNKTTTWRVLLLGMQIFNKKSELVFISIPHADRLCRSVRFGGKGLHTASNHNHFLTNGNFLFLEEERIQFLKRIPQTRATLLRFC